MDVDDFHNIVVGGGTQDSQLAPVIPYPIVLYYTYTNGLQWAKKPIITEPDTISAVRFLNNTHIVIAFGKWGAASQQFQMMIMDRNSGGVSMTYARPLAWDWAVVKNEGIIVLPSNQFLLAFLSDDNYFSIYKYSVTSSLNAISRFEFQYSLWQATAMVTDLLNDDLFISGFTSGPSATLTHMRVSNLDHYYHIRLDSGSENNAIRRLHHYIDSFSNRYLYGCKDNSTLEIIRFEVTNAVSLGGVIPSVKYSPGVSGHNCNALTAISTDKLLALTQDSSGQIFLIQVVVSLSQVKIYLLRTFSTTNGLSKVTQGMFTNENTLYYVGWTQQVTTPSVIGYPQRVGFLMSSDQRVIYSNDEISFYQMNTLQTQTITFSLFSFGRSSASKALWSYLYSQDNVGSTTVISISSWSANTDTITFQAPSPVVNYEYVIHSGYTEIFLPYYMTVLCFTYTQTSSIVSSPAFPQSIVYDGEQIIGIDSQNRGDKGIYAITMTQTLGNGSSVSQTFNLTVIDPCDYAAYTTITPPNYQYAIRQPQMSITISPFTSNVSDLYCGSFVYILTDLQNNPLPSSIFTFDNTTGEVRLYTDNRALIGETLDIKIAGYQGDYQNQIEYINYRISLILDCRFDYLTGLDTQVTYTLGEIQSFSGANFYSYFPSCYSPIYLCFDQNDLNCNDTASDVFPIINNYSPVDALITIKQQTFVKSPYVFKLKASSSISSSIAFSFLTVNVYRPCLDTIITPFKIQDKVQVIFEAPTSFIFDQWTESYGKCTPFTYQVKINNILTNSNGVINYDPTLRQFTISVNSTNQIGSYLVEIIGTLFQDGKQASTSFYVIATSNNIGPPVLAYQIPDISINLNEVSSFQLPEIIDPDGNQYKLKVDLGRAFTFVTFKDNIFSIQSKNQQQGVFEIKIQLTDINDFPMKSAYKFKIFIQQLNSTGSIPFDYETLFQYFIDNNYYKLNGRFLNKNKVEQKNITANITYVGLHGEVTIKFSEIMLELNNNSKIKEFKGLLINLIPGEENQKNQIKDWEVESYLNTTLKLKIFFEDPLAVSINVNLQCETQRYENLVKKIEPVLTATISINIILQILLGLSLKQLWRLMNTFQLLVHLPMLSLSLPANVIFTCQTLSDIASLNMIPKDQIKKWIGSIISSDDDNQNVQNPHLVRSICQNILKKLMYNPLLRSLMKGYLNFCLSLFMAVQKV